MIRKPTSTGVVLSIQRFCLDDGPGIRTAVFLKGCPLDCAWCHNPESKSGVPELSYLAKNCALCGRCAAVCPRRVHRVEGGAHSVARERCVGCGLCVKACPAGCLELAGREMTVDEIVAVVGEDRAFYGRGGGVTLSGGEPLLQAGFAVELLRAMKENGLHTCVETAGHVERAVFAEAAPLVDLFLYDYKLTDPALHRRYAGMDNALILENLRYLRTLGKELVLRCPMIPGVNDGDEHLAGVAALCRELQVPAEIMPYHILGKSKLERFGISPRFPGQMPEENASAADIERWERFLEREGVALYESKTPTALP